MSPSDINQTDRDDNLVVAMEGAIKAANIPFLIYDASFFAGEGELEGDWLVIAESPESEYAIVIESITIDKPMPTLAGMKIFERPAFKLYYPFYDRGDASVGMDDAWIIDFDDAQPDYTTEGIVDICLHTVSWFLNNEIRAGIANAIDAKHFNTNNFINPEE